MATQSFYVERAICHQPHGERLEIWGARHGDGSPSLFPYTKDDYWIAFLVLLSRVPQFEDVLLLRLPDRAALARARPQYLQDAYQQFLDKEGVTLSQIDSILRLQNFHDLRESVTRYFACCRLYHVFRFYSSNGVAKVREILQRS